MALFRTLRPLLLVPLVAACSPSPSDRHDDHGHDDHGHGDHGHDHHGDAAAAQEPWAVTAWGDTYEIFAECDPLAVGATSASFTHVTILDGFPPLREGTVTVILRGAAEHSFPQPVMKRDGIWNVEITPTEAGDFEIFYRVDAPAGVEEIAAGRVHVGDAAHPGGLVDPSGSRLAGDVPFLKEQQWRTPFATEWVAAGSIRESVQGPGRVRAAAGGDVLLAAPLDGRVRPDAAVHVGQAVRRGGTVLSLDPRAGADRTLPELEAELTVARNRLARLEELLQAEAVSLADVETARARVASLAPRVAAAGGDASAASAVAVPSPFDGAIAEVFVTAGQSVAVGDPLARVVRTDPLWIEVQLPPADAARLDGGVSGVVIGAGAARDARFVARSPAVDSGTGRIAALLEVPGGNLAPGQVGEFEVLLAGERSGVVIPGSALVDDGGVPVVYLQIEGEAFARLEVEVLALQGDRILVEGPVPGDRIVTRGAAAIRRASLTSSTLEGHVH